MIEYFAIAVVLVAAAYFLFLGAASLVRPDIASRFLLGFAGSATKHYAELAVRLAVGGAFLTVAPRTAFPAAFTVFGWVLVGTTAILALIPWRWHHRFASRTVPQAVRRIRLIGVASIAIAFLLAGSLIGG